jgi:hypothetical protein
MNPDRAGFGFRDSRAWVPAAQASGPEAQAQASGLARPEQPLPVEQQLEPVWVRARPLFSPRRRIAE